ncbi:ATP-binding protein [Streptomyces sp. NPDC048604]|uniref:ATP-binding protein n=1 Tax=Streptomyces sp. NPDC048604 TaxID=3365578 RepID=UPI003718F065
MSLPLSRRIARAALLVAAGAAPVIGAAGVAGAAELPGAGGLAGLTQLDPSSAASTVGGATDAAAPLAQEATGDAAGGAGELVGGAQDKLPTDSLPTDKLPTGGLPTGSLPGGGLLG